MAPLSAARRSRAGLAAHAGGSRPCTNGCAITCSPPTISLPMTRRSRCSILAVGEPRRDGFGCTRASKGRERPQTSGRHLFVRSGPQSRTSSRTSCCLQGYPACRRICRLRATGRQGGHHARSLLEPLATQDKARPEGDGLADPDGFACLCASACSFIWASGFRRDGDVFGVHMFRFVDDGGPQWSERVRGKRRSAYANSTAFLPGRACRRRALGDAARDDVRSDACGDRHHDKRDGVRPRTGGKLPVERRSLTPI